MNLILALVYFYVVTYTLKGVIRETQNDNNKSHSDS
jgi:hypothetical protein